MLHSIIHDDGAVQKTTAVGWKEAVTRRTAARGRCSRAVASMVDGSPLLVAIDAEAHDQIVSGRRCGDHRVRWRWRFAPFFLGVWRTSKVVSPCARVDLDAARLCARDGCALERRGEAQRFRQCCRATKYGTVREVSGCRRGRER